jgi:hypothetical protein
VLGVADQIVMGRWDREGGDVSLASREIVLVGNTLKNSLRRPGREPDTVKDKTELVWGCSDRRMLTVCTHVIKKLAQAQFSQSWHAVYVVLWLCVAFQLSLRQDSFIVISFSFRRVGQFKRKI